VEGRGGRLEPGRGTVRKVGEGTANYRLHGIGRFHVDLEHGFNRPRPLRNHQPPNARPRLSEVDYALITEEMSCHAESRPFDA
jgi:hypothetical protein